MNNYNNRLDNSKINNRTNRAKTRHKKRILKRITAGIIAVSLFGTILIAVNIYKNYNREDRYNTENSFTDDAEAAVNEVYKDENMQKGSGGIVYNQQKLRPLTPSAYIDVKWISQNPELPTGCEITALTTVLQFYGYNVSKVTMASTYLEKGTGSYFDRFIGNPFEETGYGCMAPPIVNAANKYFSFNKIDAKAVNVSESDFTTLLGYVSKGTPVIVWNTMYMIEPYKTDSWYDNGKEISWMAPEHCVVLMGYDLEKEIVYVSDPLEGIVTRDMKQFSSYYKALYSQAVIIE